MSKPNEILKPNEIKAIQLYLEGELTAQQIAEECGYANRSSLYKILEKPEAQEVMKRIANESVEKAIAILKANSMVAARNLVKIASGNIKAEDKQTVYALLQAINSVLEKSGLSSKNITLTTEEKDDDVTSKDDILASIEEYRKKKKKNIS